MYEKSPSLTTEYNKVGLYLIIDKPNHRICACEQYPFGPPSGTSEGVDMYCIDAPWLGALCEKYGLIA